MKLAEALALRSDCQTRLAQLKARLLRNATVQEGEAPAEDPNVLLAQYDALCAELVQLIRRINQTNSMTSVVGKTMTEALAERDILKQRHATYLDLAAAGTVSRSVVTRSEVRFKSAIEVAGVQKQADLLARTIRELDARIQEVNWQVNLQD
ncbi:MAG TPA: DIP1984 family protein [Advenella sp.]|nr:DIP1984 family protein [Advenella sp.]